MLHDHKEAAVSGQGYPCRVMTGASLQELVRLLLSDRYCSVVDQYRLILDEDPDYLTYHAVSTSLNLQFQLKLHDLPMLHIGGCLHELRWNCCMIDALKEAVRQRSSGRAPVEGSPGVSRDRDRKTAER